MHPIRATIEKRIHGAEKPVPLVELANALGLEPGLARYHVGVLLACGLAAVDDAGRVSGQ